MIDDRYAEHRGVLDGTPYEQRRLDWLEQNGYRGMVGLEYMPTQSTLASLSALGFPKEK